MKDDNADLQKSDKQLQSGYIRKLIVEGDYVNRDKIIKIVIQGRFVLLVVMVLFVGLMVRLFWPKPLERGNMNIAVAEFDVVDEQGRQVPNASIGKDLARVVYENLVPNGSNTNCDKTDPEIRSTDACFFPQSETGLIANSDMAAKAADILKMDMIVYGVITQSANGDWIQIAPRFYVSATNFLEGEEVVGTYELGSRFPAKGVESATLVGRLKGLRFVIDALFNMQRCDNEQAIKQLRKAEGYINENDGKSVIYFLLGNAHLASWHQMKDKGASNSQLIAQLDKTLGFYSLALDKNDGSIYPRAILGKSYVAFNMLSYSEEKDSYMHGLLGIERDLRDALPTLASSEYQQALQKAHYLLGTIYFARAQHMSNSGASNEETQPDLLNAAAEFDKALDTLNLQPDTKSTLAARVYAGLAHLSRIPDSKQALSYFQAAISHTPADNYDLLTELHYWLGIAYRADNQNTLAHGEFKNCVDLPTIFLCTQEYQARCRKELESAK